MGSEQIAGAPLRGLAEHKLGMPSCMIASSIIIPLWSDPITWGLVALATLAEVVADRAVLRWLGFVTRGLTGRLVAVQLATWCAVITFLDWLTLHSKDLTGQGLLVLQLMVVVAEVALLRVASRIPVEVSPAVPLRLSTAIALSAIGNSASTGVLIGAVALLRSMTR
jgi:hypothetical protein